MLSPIEIFNASTEPYPPILPTEFSFNRAVREPLFKAMSHLLPPAAVSRVRLKAEEKPEILRFWTLFLAAAVNRLDSMGELLQWIDKHPQEFKVEMETFSKAELMCLWRNGFSVMEAIHAILDENFRNWESWRIHLQIRSYLLSKVDEARLSKLGSGLEFRCHKFLAALALATPMRREHEFFSP